MKEADFNLYITVANALKDDYSRGYIRGLRRHYHGDNFGTNEEHEKFMALDEHHQATGAGYRDGFAGLKPRNMHGGFGNDNAKKEVVASAQIQIRCTTEQKNLAVKAAQRNGMKLSQYILSLIEKDK